MPQRLNGVQFTESRQSKSQGIVALPAQAVIRIWHNRQAKARRKRLVGNSALAADCSIARCALYVST